MSACDLFSWCDSEFHSSLDDAGRPLHSHVRRVLNGTVEISVLLRLDGAPARIHIGMSSDGEYPPDEVRGFADAEPAEYEKALRAAADEAERLTALLVAPHPLADDHEEPPC